MEEVSFEDSSDDENVVEKSLMPLHATPAAEESEDDDSNDTLVDLHVLVLEPISLEETDVVMEEGGLSSADHQLHPFDTNILSLSTAISNLHLEGKTVCMMWLKVQPLTFLPLHPQLWC